MKKTISYADKIKRTVLCKAVFIVVFSLFLTNLTAKGQIKQPNQKEAGGLYSQTLAGNDAENSANIQNGESPASSITVGCPTAKAPLDFDGDGKTDQVVVRNTGGGSGGAITWFLNYSNGGSLAVPFGAASSDYFVSGDFDGDGKADVTVWRGGAQAYFYILQSQTNTLRSDPFGQTGDDPTVVGDYTGDGLTDPAVYRSGANSNDPSFWYYRASSGPLAGQVVGTQWGKNGDFPSPGDYDGDGKYDFVVQRNNGAGTARFYLNQTTAGLTSVVYGTSTDVIVPGDYDGDCKTDIAVGRSSAGLFNWYIRNSSNGTNQSYTFGGAASDFFAHGDYDGDGIIDIGVWRSTNGTFYWRRSIDGVTGAFKWGQNLDFPVANFNRH